MKTAAALVLAFTCLFASGEALGRQLAQAPAPSGSCTPITTAATSANLTTLVQAVQTAGLTDTISSPDLSVTLFAPTNDAFQTAIDGLKSSLTELQSSGKLAGILEYHIVPTPYTSQDLQAKSGDDLPTMLSGQDLTPEYKDNKFTVKAFTNTANVVMGPVEVCKNTQVYIIDAVLVPDVSKISST